MTRFFNSLGLKAALVLAGCFILLTTALASAAVDGGVLIAGGGGSATVNGDGNSICRIVTNNNGSTLYVPDGSRAAGEFNSFVTHPPAGVGLASCVTPCSGNKVGGYCWYLSGPNQSCDTVCASHGGNNANGTINYAGTGGTLSQCSAVMQALIFNSGANGVYDVFDGTNAGCQYYGSIEREIGTPTTTGGFSYSGYQRACSCNI